MGRARPACEAYKPLKAIDAKGSYSAGIANALTQLSGVEARAVPSSAPPIPNLVVDRIAGRSAGGRASEPQRRASARWPAEGGRRAT